MTKFQSRERTEAITQLREWIRPGDTVYTVLDSVSRSGMSRVIRVVLLKVEDGGVRDLHPNYSVGKALGLRQKADGLVIGGCGMDMGFEIVYRLGRALWPAGFTCTGKDCHSNDHSNGDRNYAPHQHTDSGYALRHRWL